MRPALIVDVETVVDADMARRVLGQSDLGDDAAMALVAPPRAADDVHGFPKPLYHRVVEISVCALAGDGTVEALRPLGPQQDERALLHGFWSGFGRRAPGVRLVTYNGRRFDVPVIVQRSLLHGLSPAALWRDDYRHRFRDSHLDVMDVLSDYGGSPALSQHEAAALVGAPGKLGVAGDDVRQLHAEGRHEDIAAYCTCDVATLTLLFTRLGAHAGWCSASEREGIEQGLRDALAALADRHALYGRFLDAMG